MGCFLSRCARKTSIVERSSPVAHIAGPEKEGEEFTVNRSLQREYVIVYLRRNVGTQITENAFGDQALNLGTVGYQNSEEGSLSSDRDDGTFSKPAAESVARNGLRQLDRRPTDLGDTSSIDVLPIRDHKMLWEVLSARPGWEREVHEGSGGRSKGSVRYQITTLKSNKLLRFPSACPLACRLPWPELYEASTYMLSSFVGMVNMCTGSEIFGIENHYKTHNLDCEYPRINTMPSPPPENGTNGYGSQADCLSRAGMEGDRRSTISTFKFCNSSQAVQDADLEHVWSGSPEDPTLEDVDLDSFERTPKSNRSIRMGAAQGRIRKRGPIETATGEQSAVRNSEDPEFSKAWQTFPVHPDLFVSIPKPDGRPPPVFFRGKPTTPQSSSAEGAPAETKLFMLAAPSQLIRNSEDLQRCEASKQTSELLPSGLFANVPKPDGRPPPVCSKQFIFQPSLAKRIRPGPGLETKLLTSDALQKVSNFDSSSARPPPRQELVTFADPYQTPNRRSAYVRNEYPNLRKHVLPKDFLAPVMGSGSRLTL